MRRPIEAVTRISPRLATLGGVIVAAAVMVHSAEAQGSEHRQGFWIQGGVMAAANRSDCSNCGEFNWDEGGAAFLRAGGTISPHVLLGAEVYGFRQTDGEVTKTEIQGILAITEWYPWLHLGGFVKVGIGVANLDLFVSTLDGGSTQSSKTGMAVSLGFGWDIRVTSGISITPVINSYINAVGDLDVEPVGTADNVLTTLLTAGVGVTFH
ncbi:MAG: hypothetical protein O7E49_10720 [Gemmatimonadetes bacterium]|nr:hypothetical protein [Gemmatimonadota bacterium]